MAALYTHRILLLLAMMAIFKVDASERALVRGLLDGYLTTSRPVDNPSNTVEVKLMLGLMEIQKLSNSGEMKAHVSLMYEWKDAHLNWDESDHDGISSIYLSASDIWTPEIVLMNSVADDDVTASGSLLKVSSSGEVRLERPAKVTIGCALDLTNYPYDKQRCKILLGSWIYNTNQMNLTISSQYLNLDSYELNAQWEITSTKANRFEFYYECCPDEKYATISFDMGLSRRAGLSSCLSVGLSVFLAAFVPLLFAMPCLNPSRYILGGCLLLVLIHLMGNLEATLGTTGLTTPTLVSFYACLIVQAGLALFLSVLVTNLANRAKLQYSAPPRVLTKIFGTLGKLVLISKNVGGKKSEDGEMKNLASEEAEPVVTSGKGTGSSSADDWMLIARVLDRLFFVIFLLLITICAIALVPRH